MKKKPNIIYILDDDHRAELLGCAGHPILKTPNLDQLAQDGVRFSNAFCTSPVCTPSRCSHYLGQWERKHGVNFNSSSSVAPEAWEKSFPMQLKKEGYYLGWVGKNHVPAGDGGYSSGYLESTFDYWYGNHGHSGFYVKELKQGKLYENAFEDTQIEVFEEGVMNFLKPDSDFLQSCPRPLPERPKDQPFCLCLTFNLPHSFGTETMELRETDNKLYVSEYREQADRIPLPSTYVAYEEITTPRIPKDVYSGQYIPSYNFVKSAEALREREIRMFQSITGIDRMIGKLRETLEQLGLANDTIIVFSTDHGIHFGEHGIGGKCFLYEEDLRIPLIVFDPRLPEELRDRTLDPLALVPDLAPTVLEMAGVQVPATMQGKSLMPWIYGESPEWRDEFFAEQLMDIQNYPKSECIRSKEWKYIRYFRRTEDPAQEGEIYRGTLDDYNTFLKTSVQGELEPAYEELYHLSEDPCEEHNLVVDPVYRNTMKHMKNRLSQLLISAKDGWNPPMTIPVTNKKTILKGF